MLNISQSFFVVCAAGLLVARLVPAQPDPLKPDEIQVGADQLQAVRGQNEVILKGNVRILYQDISLSADEVRRNLQTGDVAATGNVELRRGDFVWRGAEISGNILKKTFDFPSHETVIPPWHITGGATHRQPDGTNVGDDVSVSTCEYLLDGQSHWHLEARRIKYTVDGRFTARSVVYKIGKVPVFYLPVTWGSSNTDIGGFEVRPGYRSKWGPFVDISKEWDLSEQVSMRFTVGYRGKRGVSGGNETRIRTERTRTDTLAFGLHDLNPPHDSTFVGEEFNGRFESEDDRFRLKLDHRTDLDDRLTLRVNADYLSDHDMLVDFFREEYRSNPEPHAFVNAGYFSKRVELSLEARPQLNDFHTVVERLPELRLNVPRQQVFGTPVYYQSESAAAQLRMNWRQYDRLRTGMPAPTDPKDYASDRYDTVHFLYLPRTVGVLSIVPRAGARMTYFGRTSKTDVTDAQLTATLQADDPRGDVNNTAIAVNYDDDGGDRLRFAYEAGVKMSTKSTGTWSDYRNKRWDLNGLRHVLQPFFDYTYIPEPNVEKENLYFFDVVDRIEEVNFARFGVRQRLQTRRDDETVTLIRMENYFDLLTSPASGEDHAGDIGTVIDFTPGDSFSLTSRLLIDTGKWETNVINVGTRIGPADKLNVGLSYLYRDSFTSRFEYSMSDEFTRIFSTNVFPVQFDVNHNVEARLNWPINPKTRLTTNLYVDLDEGELERHSYELSRDLHCWKATVRVEKEASELSVFLIMYLKAFSNFRLGAGI